MAEKSPSLQRHRIVQKVLTEQGITCIMHSWDSRVELEAYSREVDALFELYSGIDVIFSEDFTVLNAPHCTMARGLRIPEDFKVVGYDGTTIARLCYPPMTYVAQPIKRLAATLIDVLLRKMAGESLCENVLLPDVTLACGQTAQPVRIW